MVDPEIERITIKTIKEWLELEFKSRVDYLLEYKFDAIIRGHLDSLVMEAKDQATKHIAAKLLDIALKETSRS